MAGGAGDLTYRTPICLRVERSAERVCVGIIRLITLPAKHWVGTIEERKAKISLNGRALAMIAETLPVAPLGADTVALPGLAKFAARALVPWSSTFVMHCHRHIYRPARGRCRFLLDSYTSIGKINHDIRNQGGIGL